MRSSFYSASMIPSLFLGLVGSTISLANERSVIGPKVAPCSGSTAQAFPGGYRVGMYCGAYYVEGIGSALVQANVNAQNFGSLANSKGLSCGISYSNIYTIAGGYRANFQCSGGYISGLGSTATDTGINALGFAQIKSLGGRSCGIGYGDIYSTPGGYRVNFQCDGDITSGLGSTLSDAGNNALEFERLKFEGGRSCSISYGSIYALPGGYRVNFQCGGDVTSGVGTTLSAAGTNVLGFERLKSMGGHSCLVGSGDIYAFPGGYRANFQCGGVYISGVGSSLSDAGINALGFVELEAAGVGSCYLQTYNITIHPGGYEVKFYCGNNMVVGVGSTVTDAGQDALANASVF